MQGVALLCCSRIFPEISLAELTASVSRNSGKHRAALNHLRAITEPRSVSEPCRTVRPAAGSLSTLSLPAGSSNVTSTGDPDFSARYIPAAALPLAQEFSQNIVSAPGTYTSGVKVRKAAPSPRNIMPRQSAPSTPHHCRSNASASSGSSLIPRKPESGSIII